MIDLQNVTAVICHSCGHKTTEWETTL